MVHLVTSIYVLPPRRCSLFHLVHLLPTRTIIYLFSFFTFTCCFFHVAILSRLGRRLRLPELRLPELRLPELRLPELRLPELRLRLPEPRLPELRLPELRLRLPEPRRPELRLRLP